MRIAPILTEPCVPPGSNEGRPVVVAEEIPPPRTFDQVLPEHEEAWLMGLPRIDVFEHHIPVDVLEGIDAKRVDTHVQVSLYRFDDVRLDRRMFGVEIDGVAGEVRDLERRRLPIPARDEPLLVIPRRVEAVRVDAEEAIGVVPRAG